MNAISYQIQDGQLFVSGKQVALPSKVTKILQVGDILVALVDYTGVIRNIFGVDEAGKILWQIQIQSLLDFGFHRKYFTNIFFSEQGELLADHADGYDCCINPKDGTVEPWLPPGQKSTRPW